MNDEKSKKIADLEAEFWRKVDALPPKESKNILDGGKTRFSELFDWFTEECKKINLEYPDG